MREATAEIKQLFCVLQLLRASFSLGGLRNRILS